MTQICVFNTCLVSTHYTLNYAIHGACLWMVLLKNVYRNVTSLRINDVINIENKQLFIFLCCSALHLVIIQTSTTLHPWRKKGSSYEEKYLTEDEISAELLADTLSDVPDDADSDSSIIGNRQNKTVHPLLSYSDKEQSANESDDDETLDLAVSTWVKTDKTPNLGPFTGNPVWNNFPLTRWKYHK